MQCEGLSAGIVTGMGTTAPQINDLQTPHNLLSFPCNLSPWETTLWSRELCLWCKAKSFCKPLTAWLQDAFTTTPQEIQSCSCSLRSSLDASVSISSKSSWNFTTQDQKNPFFFGFLFTSNRYPLELMSSLRKQQALTVPVASAKLLVSLLSTHLLVQSGAPLNFPNSWTGQGRQTHLPKEPCHALTQPTNCLGKH